MKTLTNIYTIVSNFIEAHEIFSLLAFFYIALIGIFAYCWFYHRDEIVIDWEEDWMD